MIQIDEDIFNELNPFLIDKGNDLSKVIERYVKELYVLKTPEIDKWNKEQLEIFLNQNGKK